MCIDQEVYLCTDSSKVYIHYTYTYIHIRIYCDKHARLDLKLCNQIVEVAKLIKIKSRQTQMLYMEFE